jgi:heme o synthase
MTDTSACTSQTLAASSQGTYKDYLALMKPRVMSLAVFTSLTGMVVAPSEIDPLTGLLALAFIAIGAGAAGTLNMWYDADIDRLMSRTASRPIPQNHVSRETALALGLVLAMGSVVGLGALVNWAAAGLLALTIGYYVIVYTMWLKRRTPHNIVIGGAAGAFPPMIGWAAATGGISLESVLLFAIIFLWTPPHFWSLALFRARDYERANIPMLPVVSGKTVTRRQILAYSVAMAAAALGPVFTGLGGWAFLAVSAAGGAAFLALAVNVCCRTEGHAADQAARRLFAFSIFYLFALFAALLAEHSLTRLIG